MCPLIHSTWRMYDALLSRCQHSTWFSQPTAMGGIPISLSRIMWHSGIHSRLGTTTFPFCMQLSWASCHYHSYGAPAHRLMISQWRGRHTHSTHPSKHATTFTFLRSRSCPFFTPRYRVHTYCIPKTWLILSFICTQVRSSVQVYNPTMSWL